MSTIREEYLRNLPHPNVNETLKCNTQSAIKLLKTGKLVQEFLCSKIFDSLLRVIILFVALFYYLLIP